MSLVFEKLFKLIKAYFIFVGFLVTALFLLVFLMISKSNMTMSSSSSVETPMEDSHMIHIDWSHLNISSSESEIAGIEALMNNYFSEDHSVYIPKLESQLETLAADPRVKGLFINLAAINASLSQLDELRSALLKFKESSKKPLYFWMPFAETKSYYLASVGDEIIMTESGQLFLMGPVLSSVYFGEAAKKLGINFDVIKSGSFKGAFETFVRNKPSDFTKTSYESMEKSLRDHLLSKMSESSEKLDESALRAAFKHSIFSAPEALEKNLITELAYLPATQSKYEEKHKAPFYKFRNFLAQDNPHKETSIKLDEDGIALIEAVGEFKLMDDSGSSISPKPMAKELSWARENENVKAVVLRISSPGGDAISADLIWDEVKRLAEVKPLVVSMGSVAASGGYYIAAPAKKIFALPSTITGSIGTISMSANLKDFEEKYGISFYLQTDSDRAKILDMGQDLSKEDRSILQNTSSKVYDQFIQKVAEGRNLTKDYVRTVAEGRPWTGSQAKKLKLIDEFGGLREALIEAKVLAGFSKESKVPVHRWKPQIRNFSDCFQNQETLKRCFTSGSALLKSSLGFSLKQQLQDLDLKTVQQEFGKRLKVQM